MANRKPENLFLGVLMRKNSQLAKSSQEKKNADKKEIEVKYSQQSFFNFWGHKFAKRWHYLIPNLGENFTFFFHKRVAK